MGKLELQDRLSHPLSSFGRRRQTRLYNISERVTTADPPNCIGYAFYTLGLVPIEGFIEPSNMTVLNYYFKKVRKLKNADAIAAVGVNRDRIRGAHPVRHIAVVDKQDRNYVMERMGTGLPIKRTQVEKAFIGYIDPLWRPRRACKLVYLKLRPNKWQGHKRAIG